MLAKIELMKEFKSEKITHSLSQEAMKIAVKALKLYQADSKGRLFQCFVFNRDNHDELVQTLQALYTGIDKWVNGSRCQLLYKNELHWSVIDIQIINGQASLFLLDSANSYQYTLSALNLIYTNCPNAKITYFGLAIQKTPFGCDYLAINLAVSLSKIENLHQLLSQYAHNGPVGVFEGGYPAYIENLLSEDPDLEALNTPEVINTVRNINYLSYNNLPKIFGGLFKNIQDPSLYERFLSGHGFIRNNKGSLDDYVSKHVQMKSLFRYDEPRKMYLAWEYKAQKIQNFALEYLSKESSQETNPDLEMFAFLNVMTSMTEEELGHAVEKQVESAIKPETDPQPQIVRSRLFTPAEKNHSQEDELKMVTSLCTLY